MTSYGFHDYLSSLTLFLLLSFTGFSLFIWGIHENDFGLGGFGLIFILICLFSFRKTIPKHLFLGCIIGAVSGTIIAIPIGLLIGDYLKSLFGYLAAALWGIISVFVLIGLVARWLPIRFRIRPRKLTVVLFIAIIAGACFGIVSIGSRMGNLYGPIGGTMLIGWTFGIILGLIAGQRLMPKTEELTSQKHID